VLAVTSTAEDEIISARSTEARQVDYCPTGVAGSGLRARCGERTLTAVRPPPFASPRRDRSNGLSDVSRDSHTMEVSVPAVDVGVATLAQQAEPMTARFSWQGTNG
jgi:hypothetical protein